MRLIHGKAFTVKLIGFEVNASEYVLEKIDNKNESAEKGKLNTND